jgi:hypothetical protein
MGLQYGPRNTFMLADNCWQGVPLRGRLFGLYARALR